MKYLCTVCGQNFPFTSDLASHEIVHSDEKKSIAVTQSVEKAIKPKLNLITITITGTSKSQQSCKKLNVVYATKFFSKVKYLKEHQKSHVDDLPFGCHNHGA